MEDEPQLLLDPNQLSEDGIVALMGRAVSEDGKVLAYGLSSAGSDWQEWRVCEVDTGRDLADHPAKIIQEQADRWAFLAYQLQWQIDG